MKTKFIFICLFLLGNCAKSQEVDMEYLATKNGLHLTEAHLKIYLSMVSFGSYETLSEEDINTHKAFLLEDFYEDPIETLSDLEEHVRLNPDQFNNYNDDSEVVGKQTGSENNFDRIQRLLDPSGEFSYAFSEVSSEQLRNHLKGFSIHREDSYAGSGDLGGGYSYQETINFCTDGTFIFSSISGAAIDGGITHERINFEGLWTTFLQEGKLIIALYSQHPHVMQMNPKGMIPIWVKSYDAAAVRTASGEQKDFYYRRVVNQMCD